RRHQRHFLVGVSVFFRVFPNLVAGPVEILPLRDVAAVWKWYVLHGIGIQIFESKIAEAQFVIANHRIFSNLTVFAGANIVVKAFKRELRGLRAAADGWPSFQDNALESRLAQICGRGQAVMPGTCDNEIVMFRRRRTLRQSKRTERQWSDSRS